MSDLAAIVVLAMVCAALWTIGAALAPARPAAEQVAAGFIAALLTGVVVMAQPLFGVSLVGAPWLLRAALLTAVVAAVWRRPRFARPQLLPLAIGIALACAVSIGSIIRPTDQYPGLDVAWHEGWIRQLAAGDPEPGGLYAHVPSAYPWLGHAASAAVQTGFGLRMAETLLVMESVAALVLALGIWLLARELRFTATEATWAMALALAGGGLGWLIDPGRHAVLTVTPSTINAYHGDFLLAPAVTTALGDVAPPLPRELGIACIPLAVWIALRAIETRSGWLAAAAGGCAGAVALIAPIAAISIVAAAAAAAVVTRTRVWLPWLAAFLAASAVWVLPLAWHAHQLGGFVRLSRTPTVSPDALQLAVAWGAMIPLAAAGVAVLARRPGRIDRRRLLAVVAGVTVPALLVALLPATPTAVPALGRALRYLPAATIALCLVGGLGMAALLGMLRGSARTVAAAAACLLLFTTPVLASLGGRSSADASKQVLRCDRPVPITADQVFTVITRSPRLGGLITRGVFSMTGAHVVYTRDPRIRYRNWDDEAMPQPARRRIQVRLAHGAWPGWLRAVVADDEMPPPRGRPGSHCTFGGHALTVYLAEAGV